jgi:antitoxin VapB
MQTERHVRLFRNGRNQAVRIPREFEMEGNEAVIRRDSGGRLIIEPVVKVGLLTLLADWEATDDILTKIDDPPVTPEDIF